MDVDVDADADPTMGADADPTTDAVPTTTTAIAELTTTVLLTAIGLVLMRAAVPVPVSDLSALKKLQREALITAMKTALTMVTTTDAAADVMADADASNLVNRITETKQDVLRPGNLPGHILLCIDPEVSLNGSDENRLPGGCRYAGRRSLVIIPRPGRPGVRGMIPAAAPHFDKEQCLLPECRHLRNRHSYSRCLAYCACDSPPAVLFPVWF